MISIHVQHLEYHQRPLAGALNPENLGAMTGEFSDAALVLVGHGSTLNADSALPTYFHGDTLRARGIFGQVRECFWKQEPGISAVLRGVFPSRVFIVPVFISDGYFTEEIIPRELGFPRAPAGGYRRQMIRGTQRVVYTEPVGTHPRMTEVILARAGEAVGSGGPTPAEISLFVAGHGTGNNENSRKAIERQVERISALRRYRDVHAVFMEEDPRIADCHRLAQAENIVVTPFFISDGLHSYEDIPVMLGESESVVQERFRRGQPTWTNPTERHGRNIWYARSIGTEPGLADVILDRVRELADAEPVQLASVTAAER